jgi:hypothetical protein
MVNILRLTVAFLNATMNVKPETQNRRLEPTGLAKPDETRGLTGTGPALARQESAGRVFGRFWNRTDPFLRSKPGPLASYPDPLLTLGILLVRLDIKATTSAKNISIRVDWLRQRTRAPSERLQTPRWGITPRPASMPRVALHIAL